MSVVLISDQCLLLSRSLVLRGHSMSDHCAGYLVCLTLLALRILFVCICMVKTETL